MKDIKDYIDSFQMIVTKSGDGGDSCAHGCAIIYADTILNPNRSDFGDLNPVVEKLHTLEKESGRYVRHPDPAKWYSDIDRLSRDQMTPLLCLYGLMHETEKLWPLFREHLKHGLLFAWNFRRNFVYPTLEEHIAKSTPDVKWDYKKKIPDPTFFEIWATWIRAWRAYPLYPLLLILDLENLVGSVKHRYFPSTDIQMNHVIMTDFATRIMPTPISLLSRWVYGKKIARWALQHKWGDIVNEPPVHSFLIPLINSWKVRE